MSVISQLVGVVVKCSTVVKIHKYKGIHDQLHFIPMAMEVHGTLEHDLDRFIKECAHLFHNRQSRGHLFCSFCIQFFKQCVSIVFQHVLTFVIDRKITLAGDAYSRPLIIIQFHDLHLGDIRGAMGEIVSYHEKDQLSPFFGSCKQCIFWFFLGLPFCFLCDGSSHQLLFTTSAKITFYLMFFHR